MNQTERTRTLTTPGQATDLLQEATTLLEEEIQPRMMEELPRIHAARHFRDRNGLHVQVMAPNGGSIPPPTALTQDPRGFIHLAIMGSPAPDQNMRHPHEGQHRGYMTSHLAHLMLNQLAWTMGPRKTAVLLASEKHMLLHVGAVKMAKQTADDLMRPMPPDDLPIPREFREQHPDNQVMAALNMMTDLLSQAPQTLRDASPKNHNRRLHPGWEPDSPEAWTDPKEFHEDIIERAARAAEQEAPQWTPIQHRREPQHSIRVMFNEANQPALVITEMDDGTVRLDPQDASQPRFNFNQANFTREPVRQMTEIILENVLRIHPNPAAIMQPSNFGRVKDIAPDIQDPQAPFIQVEAVIPKAAHQARLLLDRTMAMPDIPEAPRTKRTDSQKLPALVTRITRRFMVGNDLPPIPTSRKYSTSGEHSNLAYNIDAVNRDIFAQVPESSQAAVRYFRKAVIPQCNRLVRLRNPGELIRTVQNHLDLDPALWKWFLRAGQHVQHHEEPESTRAEIRVQAALLRDANRPDASPERIAAVAGRSHLTSAIRQAPLASTDPWKAWARAVSLFLDRTGPPEPRETADLSHIGDAIRHQVNQHDPQPWPQESWEETIARADRITRADALSGASRRLSWDSALPATEIGGFSFIPATSSAELQHWGQVMGNCVATYDHQCAARDHRIFIAHDPQGNPVATIELGKQHQNWCVTQAEGKKRSTPARGLSQAADQLARLYQEAWEARKKDPRKEEPAET